MRAISVYLSARISEDAHQWNKTVCEHLKPPFEVFFPQDNNPWQMNHEDLPHEVYQMDLTAMKNSDMALLLPNYGRDCAWEAGWYANSEKPLVIFVDDQIDWLRDWMVKGGSDFIITINAKTFQILKADPILNKKSVIHIKKLEDLHEEMLKIHNLITSRAQSVKVAPTAELNVQLRT